jgi:hypothetical protein
MLTAFKKGSIKELKKKIKADLFLFNILANILYYFFLQTLDHEKQ